VQELGGPTTLDSVPGAEGSIKEIRNRQQLTESICIYIYVHIHPTPWQPHYANHND